MTSTHNQMVSCLDSTIQMDAYTRLHRAKAISNRSQADMLSRQLRDVRDFMLTHHEAVRALLEGQKLVPVSSARLAVVQMDNDGGPE